MSAGAALFAKLGEIGVEYVFVNSGTDFPPIIEGLAEAAAAGIDLPTAVVVPHEHAALGMAHGFYFATGRAQAVMLHTNVGLANGVIGAINAATDNVPILLMSGRTPVTERGRFGARTVPIGWGQEMRDQAALVRESCKWDYELRFPEQIGELLERALAIADSTPKGPVYLSLPREVLCETVEQAAVLGGAVMRASTAAPHPQALARAAELLARAERPVIFAQRGAGSRRGYEALARLADDWAIPVCQYWATRLAIATDHPMHAGTDPAPWIGDADVILVIDSLAPWSPEVHRPRSDATVIQLGPDPLHSRVPVRNFPSDVSIACDTAEGILALESAMRGFLEGGRPARETRRRAVAARNAEARGKTLAMAQAGRSSMTKAFVAKCVSDALQDRDATVLSELGCPLAPMTLRAHGSWYQEPFSGGLGWSLPCAMGMKLANPERLVVATMGDGSYVFANPTACHQVMEALSLPVLIVILNNTAWGAVRDSVTGLYPGGHASLAARVPLTSLAPSPDFTKTAEASRAWARRVDTPEALPILLEEALGVVADDGRPALLDVQIGD